MDDDGNAIAIVTSQEKPVTFVNEVVVYGSSVAKVSRPYIGYWKDYKKPI